MQASALFVLNTSYSNQAIMIQSDILDTMEKTSLYLVWRTLHAVPLRGFSIEVRGRALPRVTASSPGRQAARLPRGRPTSYTGSAVGHAPPGATSAPRVQSRVQSAVVAPGVPAKAVAARPPRSGVRAGLGVVGGRALEVAPEGSREGVRPKGGGGGRKTSSAQGSNQVGPSRPSTLQRRACTLHPAPYTPNATPSTLNHQPSTINPQLQPVNSQPSTLNGRDCGRRAVTGR